MTRRGLMSVSLVAGLACVAGCRRDHEEQPGDLAGKTKPDVIFILVDTLRADRLGCYGYRRDNSPRIDALAREGILFERAVAPSPWTQPSMASLFAGLYPTAHGVLGYRRAYEGVAGTAPAVTVFADEFETLAESMKRGGYETAAFVSNPFIVEDFGFAQGFDHFDDSFASNLTNGDVVNEAALAWLDARSDERPLFLYLHYMDCHGPYAAGPRFLDPLVEELERTGVSDRLSPEAVGKLDYLWKPPTGPTDLARHDKLSHFREYWAARYESGIRQFDHHLEALEAELARRGLWEDAFVILTADHGEALYEHGYWDHGYSVYHTDLHVPLILRWPGRLPAGQRIEELVRLIDVHDTICDALALAPPDNTQGRSLKPLLLAGGDWEAVSAYAEGVKIGPEQRAVYAAGWKLLVRTESDETELYRIVSDPSEQNDIAAEYPKLVVRMRALLDEQLERNRQRARGVDVRQVPLGREKIEQIRSLGYLGD